MELVRQVRRHGEARPSLGNARRVSTSVHSRGEADQAAEDQGEGHTAPWPHVSPSLAAENIGTDPRNVWI